MEAIPARQQGFEKPTLSSCSVTLERTIEGRAPNPKEGGDILDPFAFLDLFARVFDLRGGELGRSSEFHPGQNPGHPSN